MAKRKAYIDFAQCDNNPWCQAKENCPEGALFIGLDGKIAIEEDKCTGCGMCYMACPRQAIFFK